MNWFFISAIVILALALLTASRFFIWVIKSLWQQWQVKKHGEIAKAEILEARIMNEQANYLPYIKLKLRVHRKNDTSFVSELDSFVSMEELKKLNAGGWIDVKYHPVELNRIVLVRTTLNHSQSDLTPAYNEVKLALA